MPLDTFLIFLMTTAVVVFSPGAASVTVATQGAANGGRRALCGVVGIASANAVFFALSATGIASLILASHLAFSVIKWVGVAYLVWLGLTALLSRSGAIRIREGRGRSRLTMLFAQGFVVEFANPKALLYFAAILPQFLDPAVAILPQILIMGATTFPDRSDLIQCLCLPGRPTDARRAEGLGGEPDQQMRRGRPAVCRVPDGECHDHAVVEAFLTPTTRVKIPSYRN